MQPVNAGIWALHNRIRHYKKQRGVLPGGIPERETFMTFSIISAVLSDSPNIYRLMNEGAETVAQKEWFCPDNQEFIENHMDRQGFILKAVCEEEENQLPAGSAPDRDITGSIPAQGSIAAFLLVRFPGLDSDNLGSSLHLSARELPLVAHMETVVVSRAYTGNGLMRRLLRAGEEKAASMGYRFLMATVHPENLYSLRNFQCLGYEKIEEALKYGGLRRWILGKRL